MESASCEKIHSDEAGSNQFKTESDVDEGIMTRQDFNKAMTALLAAFNYAQEKTTKESEDIYFEMLKDIPAAIWNEGVKKCLKESTFFPTIHDLGVACFGETVEHMEDRCDPLRYRQNYQVRIEAVSWQENMAKALNPAPQIEHKPLPAISSRVDRVIADIGNPKSSERYPDGTTEQSRKLLSTIWRMQDANGFHGVNNPSWYKP
jgi:hypothetical protein